MNKPKKYCPHTKKVWITIGRRYFSGGEVWDDIRDLYICQDCGQTVDGDRLSNENDGLDCGIIHEQIPTGQKRGVVV